MVTSYLRGHEIEFINDEWIYRDTKEPTATTYGTRPCGYCGLGYTKEGHDGCLGVLQGLMNACCGHGDVKGAYVQFIDSSVVEGEDAITIMDILKRNDIE
jgi:hypothetical protein